MLYLVTKKCAYNLLEFSKTKAINHVPLGSFFWYVTFTKRPFSKAFTYCRYTIHATIHHLRRKVFASQPTVQSIPKRSTSNKRITISDNYSMALVTGNVTRGFAQAPCTACQTKIHNQHDRCVCELAQINRKKNCNISRYCSPRFVYSAFFCLPKAFLPLAVYIQRIFQQHELSIHVLPYSRVRTDQQKRDIVRGLIFHPNRIIIRILPLVSVSGTELNFDWSHFFSRIPLSCPLS